MYTVFVRHYSVVEGLLVWKQLYNRSSFEDSVQLANRLLAQKFAYKYATPYVSESNTHYEEYGNFEHVRCMQVHPCNIQIRKDGKLIAWKHLL